jgi:chromosome segregation ATPase
MKSNTFVYGLQALLRKRHSELDQARQQLAAARRQLDQSSDRLRQGLAHVRQLEEQRRALMRPGARIEVDAATRVQQSLTLQRAESERRGKEHEQARQSETHMLEGVRSARESLQVIERHRDNAAAVFDAGQRYAAQRLVDELYLLGLQSAAPQSRAGGAWQATTARAGTSNDSEEKLP